MQNLVYNSRSVEIKATGNLEETKEIHDDEAEQNENDDEHNQEQDQRLVDDDQQQHELDEVDDEDQIDILMRQAQEIDEDDERKREGISIRFCVRKPFPFDNEANFVSRYLFEKAKPHGASIIFPD